MEIKQKDARRRGNVGEDAVCRYLRRRGFRILKRNFTVKGGEIDIIASRFSYIVFVKSKPEAAQPIPKNTATPPTLFERIKNNICAMLLHAILHRILPRKSRVLILPRYILVNVKAKCPSRYAI